MVVSFSIIKKNANNHQAKCLMCVGTKTVTVIFLGAWGKEWQLKCKTSFFTSELKSIVVEMKLLK
jgi:hypothetical protein